LVQNEGRVKYLGSNGKTLRGEHPTHYFVAGSSPKSVITTKSVPTTKATTLSKHFQNIEKLHENVHVHINTKPIYVRHKRNRLVIQTWKYTSEF